MPSSSPTYNDTESSKRPLTRVPAWIPISAFLGTTVALAIPLVLLRRRRTVSLRDNIAPPPRRAIATTSVHLRRPTPLPTSSSTSSSVDNLFSADPDKASLHMMTALAHISASSATLAVQAFAIATGIVAVGGTVIVWGVREALDVKDAREFGNAMRFLLSRVVPSLSSAIYRPPQRGEEREDPTAPFVVQENWKWEDAETRLRRAYETGGISLWCQIALRELEAEATLERERRIQEIESRSP